MGIKDWLSGIFGKSPRIEKFFRVNLNGKSLKVPLSLSVKALKDQVIFPGKILNYGLCGTDEKVLISFLDSDQLQKCYKRLSKGYFYVVIKNKDGKLLDQIKLSKPHLSEFILLETPLLEKGINLSLEFRPLGFDKTETISLDSIKLIWTN